MNKVVSIELAAQVFWIDEEAYAALRAYMDKLRDQLEPVEGGDEIFQDIELRVAELFYALNSDESKAISAAQLEQVIDQVGFIDGQDEDKEAQATAAKPERRSYLDKQNKILGGVCAGLARRFGVPAFILRVLFVALAFVFGLGAVLYLIFWLSLEDPKSRKAALAAEGKAQTAKGIANPPEPRVSPLLTLQRIIFLPVSIIGALVAVTTGHFRQRKNSYRALGKNLLAVAVGLVALGFLVGLYETSDQPIFPWPISWLVTASVIYLLTLGVALFVREVYLEQPRFQIAPVLKRCAVIPAVFLVVAIVFLNLGQTDHHHERVEERLALNSDRLLLAFQEQLPEADYSRAARFEVRSVPRPGNEVILKIEYSAYGSDPESAEANARAVNYLFSFDEDRLVLGRFFELAEGTLARAQGVEVIVEVPEGVTLVSDLPLAIARYDGDYYYRLQSGTREPSTYLSTGEFLHEYGEDYANKLSRNERDVLEDKFCEEFFISESWRCPTNIDLPVLQNTRFDRAFLDDAERIEELRQFLLPDRSIFASNLKEMNAIVDSLSVEYRVRGEFQGYLDELMLVKAAPEAAVL
ncbi:MAG: PspC domain-containing protein [Pseudomonadota bacterium]